MDSNNSTIRAARLAASLSRAACLRPSATKIVTVRTERNAAALATISAPLSGRTTTYVTAKVDAKRNNVMRFSPPLRSHCTTHRSHRLSTRRMWFITNAVCHRLRSSFSLAQEGLESSRLARLSKNNTPTSHHSPHQPLNARGRTGGGLGLGPSRSCGPGLALGSVVLNIVSPCLTPRHHRGTQYFWLLARSNHPSLARHARAADENQGNPPSNGCSGT
jgi:hypothetical protein